MIKLLEIVTPPTDILATKDILLIALIIFIIAIYISLKYNMNWLLFSSSILWLIPIFIVDNIFINVFSIIMIIGIITIAFFQKEDDFL